MFRSIFNGVERSTREMTRVHDTISKKEIVIRLSLNEDPLAGARILITLDEWWNLLFEQCESAESPADCEQCFSTNDTIA